MDLSRVWINLWETSDVDNYKVINSLANNQTWLITLSWIIPLFSLSVVTVSVSCPGSHQDHHSLYLSIISRWVDLHLVLFSPICSQKLEERSYILQVTPHHSFKILQWLLNGYWFSFWGDENILESIQDDGCPTLWMSPICSLMLHEFHLCLKKEK